jgi:hypothetical protein
VVATATIAAFVGLGGLGRYIIDGYAARTSARSPAAPSSWPSWRSPSKAASRCSSGRSIRARR